MIHASRTGYAWTGTFGDSVLMVPGRSFVGEAGRGLGFDAETRVAIMEPSLTVILPALRRLRETKKLNEVEHPQCRDDSDESWKNDARIVDSQPAMAPADSCAV